MCSDNSAVVIQVNNLSKSYRIYNHPRDRLLQSLWGRDRRCKPKRFYKEFWALQELNFSLARGQTLGVVGRNGSGKSTLLQLICGTLSPSSGSVHVSGRIGALLELGSGFNPEFSGLENVFLNAALLGLTKEETNEKLDQILAFADIGEFIDQPVKTYSSGMTVRLAFAVQAHVNPDVLVVDEALAVGDEFFQKKCYDHLERLKELGTAVLLVTHSCNQIIQHCDQALLLHKGKARMLGEPARVTVTYQRLINATDAEWDVEFSESVLTLVSNKARNTPTQTKLDPQRKDPIPSLNNAWLDENLKPQTTEIYPSKGAAITDVWIEIDSGKRVNVLPFGQSFVVVFNYSAEVDLQRVGLACHLANKTGLRISGQTVPSAVSGKPGWNISNIKANSKWQVRYSFHGGLWPGIYFIGGGIITWSASDTNFIHRVIDYRAFRITDGRPATVIGASSLQSAEPAVIGLSATPTNENLITKAE